MPYAIGNLVDEETPGSVRSINPGDPLSPDEVQVPDKPEDQTYPAHWIWEADTQSLRPSTEEDRIRWAIREKDKELEQERALRSEDVIPLWEAVDKILRDLSSTEPRFVKVKQHGDHLEAKKQEARAKSSADAVRNVRWED